MSAQAIDTPTPPAMVGTRLSVMMFLQFFVWGAWYVSVGNYMKAIGLGDSIGHAYTVGPLAALLSPFFLGMIADRFFSTERVLGVMHIIGGLALLAAPTVADMCVRSAVGQPIPVEGERAPFLNTAHLPFLGVLFLHMLCYMPTLGLTNTVSFHNVTNAEKQFPLIRVFGTIGWIAAGLAIGYAAGLIVPESINRADKAAMDSAMLRLPHFFFIAGGAGLLLGMYSFSLPHTPPPAAGRRASIRDILGFDSLALLRQRSFFVFIASSLLICIPLAAYYAYAPVFAGAAGISPDEVPVKMSFGQMSEFAFMLVMPLLFARLGVKWMIAVGMLAWVVRYGLFAGAADTRIEWMVIGGILLHGICYDFFFVTGQVYVDQKASKEIRGQAQGFLVMVTQGLGLGIGAQVAGALVKHFTSKPAGIEVVDWRMVWLVPCIIAAMVLVMFVAFFRDDVKETRGNGSA